MSDIIEVYVEREKRVAIKTGRAPSVSGHPCAGDEPMAELKKEYVLPETHEYAINIAKKVGKEKGFKIKVYDKSKRLERFRANRKGVNETPTIIVGNQRIAGNITEKKLLGLLY